jgi:putative N6-adenine-specific DNA methylase
MAKFFLVVPVNMERLAFYELCRALSQLKIEEPSVETFPGGLELELPLNVGLSLNRILKIPVRILLRVIEEEAKTEKEFVALLKKSDLKKFMPLGNIHVSSRSSFLRFKNSITETVEKTIGFRPRENGASVFVRFFRDICTLSINTSGEDLYRRGYDKWVGEAPVRDNIASGLLQLLIKGIDTTQPIELIDPMAGSGTFLLEASMLGRSAQRKYACESWDGVKLIDVPDEPVFKQLHLIAADQSEKHVEILKHNFSLIHSSAIVGLEDLFKQSPQKKQRTRLVICNPPYGKRLKTGGSEDYFLEILDQIIKVYQPDRVGLLTPRVWLEHSKYEKLSMLDIENSGIEAQFVVFSV